METKGKFVRVSNVDRRDDSTINQVNLLLDEGYKIKQMAPCASDSYAFCYIYLEKEIQPDDKNSK